MTVLRVDLRLPLDRFALELEFETRARRLGLFGPSGAGKTSVLEAIAGWRTGARGYIELDGHVLLDSERGIAVPIAQRGIGYVPQDALLFPHWSVRQNLEAGSARAHAAGVDVRALARSAIELLELGALLESSPLAISAGERQRVALARALCSAPALLVLDEPFAALDLALRQRALAYLARAAQEFDTPLLYVSHEAAELGALCEEVVLLERGRRVAQGAPFELASEAWRRSGGASCVENVLHGRVLERRGSLARVELAPGVELECGARALEPGARVALALRSDEILLASVRPVGLSARNVLAARIESIAREGEAALVRVRLEGGAPGSAVAPGAAAAPGSAAASGAAAALGSAGAPWPVLAVQLTGAAVDELALAPGRAVHAIAKAHSLRLLAELPGGAGGRWAAAGASVQPTSRD
jgi:molybdate transport system ATP-binding protein